MTDSERYTDYQILKTIENNTNLSQRLISKHTGINVSSINYALRRLIKKGYVKITSMSKRRILYHLTSSGLAQKGKLAFNFFLHNYNLFSDVREIISGYLGQPELKGKKLAIVGLTELTEIVYLCIKNNEVHFAGLYEDNLSLIGTKWLDGVIHSVDKLKNANHTDYLIDTKSFSPSGLSNLMVLTPIDYFKNQNRKNITTFSVNNKGAKIELQILGAVRTVTGSSTLLKACGKNILIDCGLFHGDKEYIKTKNTRFHYDPKQIDYLILTHAHLDHSGNIPRLIDHGFRGEILSHHATVDIFPLLLEDFFVLNRKIRFNKSREQIMERVIAQSWGFEYNRWNRISKGIRFQLLDAGHILGSATIQLDINGEYLVFSGDIGNISIGIIKDPVSPDRADILIMESTYGGRSHSEVNKELKFKEIINRALKYNGKVLIPSFALGRTQEIIYQLNDMAERQEITNVPVFIDSPLSVKITESYERYKECFDEETLKRLESKDAPLDFDKLFGVERHLDSVRLMGLPGPAIIIAGSGMCAGGRIVNHLSKLLAEKTTDVIFVGYQARGTLGADILKHSGKKEGYVVIDGEKVYIKAAIHEISGFSAHADHDGLLSWIEGIEKKPHTIYLNHGEPEAQVKLQKGLQKKFTDISVTIG